MNLENLFVTTEFLFVISKGFFVATKFSLATNGNLLVRNKYSSRFIYEYVYCIHIYDTIIDYKGGRKAFIAR